jgi:hypothetical protein
VRRTLKATSGSPELHAYVNYAHGDETMEEMYGTELWGLEKLRALKEQYGLEGGFSYYAPI